MTSDETPAEKYVDITFEAALANVEQALTKLEDGQLSLSDSLSVYEEGVRHLKQCYQLLEAAEAKVELVTGVDAEGQPSTKPLADCETPDDSSSSKPAAPRKSRKTRPAAPPEPPERDVDGPQGLF